LFSCDFVAPHSLWLNAMRIVRERRSRFHLGSVTAALSFILGSSTAFSDQSPEVLEETVCGWYKERAAFFSWSIAAGRPKPDAWKTVTGAGPASHKTRDGRTLRGFKITGASGNTSDAMRSFMLFAQGNAMLADRSLDALKTFAIHGVDVFVYDYRGYGSSEGKRRLKAIVSDYQGIFDTLRKAYSGRKYLYGTSFGGIVLLNIIGRGADFDKAVIDSAPSRLSVHGCPAEYDPVLNLPTDGAKLLLISGKKDSVVTPADQAELISTAKSRGALVVIAEDFAHPFMDSDLSVHLKRQNLVKDFFFDSGS
jgi:alpha/beta superfamily hydrolase